MKGRWEIKIKNAPVFNRNKTNLSIFNLPCIYETLATDSKGNRCIDLKAVLASSDSLLEVVIEGQLIHIDCLWQGPHRAWPMLMLAVSLWVGSCGSQWGHFSLVVMCAPYAPHKI